jgi:hypothetical protein
METFFYGNGPIMANVLTSIVYILNSADYSMLLNLMLVLAGALMIGQWHMRNSSGGSGTHGLFVAIGTVMMLYYGGWTPKETLVIYDPLNNFQTAVTNVPEAFAQVVQISNKITTGFGDLFDQGFALSGFPNSMSYNNGMTSGLMAIDSLGELQSLDQFLTENISGYFKDCVFPAMLMNNGSGPSVNDIAQSTNLLQTIQTHLSNAWVTNYYSSSNPGGTSITCSQMYTNLNTDITNAINNPTGSISQAYANQLAMGMGGSAAYTNPSSDVNLLGTAANYIISGSVSSQQLISQAVLINAFNPALQSFAAQNGLNPNALSNALTQNILETTTTMSSSYALAKEMLPMSFAVISALIYAIMPIMFAMMFIPQLTKKFGLMAFSLLMWIAFWAPLASVVNAIVQASAAQTFSVMGVSSIAPQNWSYLMRHTYTLMAIAGDMMFSVPVLAFALASGSSYAMTSVAGSIAGLSKAAAARGATTMSDIGGAQGEQSQASQAGQLGMAAKANKVSPEVAAQQLMESQGANSAGFLEGFNSTGGFGTAMRAAANNTAKATGAGLGLDNIPTALNTGFGSSQSLVGQIKGMQEISQMNDTSIEQLANLTQQLSSAGVMGNSQAYGGDMKLAQQTAAMNTLQNLRQNKGFTELMEAGHMLPKNFNSLSAPEQVKALANGMSQLGAGARDVYLNAQQAQEVFHNSNMGAGTYSVGFDKNGNMVQVVGKGGADTFQVTPHGVVQTDSTVGGNTVGKSVLTQTKSGWTVDNLGRTVNDYRNKNLSGNETIRGNKFVDDNSNSRISGNTTTTYLGANDIYSGTRFHGPSANAPQTQNILLPETKANQPFIQGSTAQLKTMIHSPNGVANASQSITDAVNKIAPFETKLTQALKSQGSLGLKAYFKAQAGAEAFGSGAVAGVEGNIGAQVAQIASQDAASTSKQVQQNFQSGLNTILKRGDVDSAVNYARAYAGDVKSGQLDKAIKMTNQFVPERDRVQMPNMANAVKQEVEHYKQEAKKQLNDIRGAL